MKYHKATRETIPAQLRKEAQTMLVSSKWDAERRQRLMDIADQVERLGSADGDLPEVVKTVEGADPILEDGMPARVTLYRCVRGHDGTAIDVLRDYVQVTDAEQEGCGGHRHTHGTSEHGASRGGDSRTYRPGIYGVTR